MPARMIVEVSMTPIPRLFGGPPLIGLLLLLPMRALIEMQPLALIRRGTVQSIFLFFSRRRLYVGTSVRPPQRLGPSARGRVHYMTCEPPAVLLCPTKGNVAAMI